MNLPYGAITLPKILTKKLNPTLGWDRPIGSVAECIEGHWYIMCQTGDGELEYHYMSPVVELSPNPTADPAGDPEYMRTFGDHPQHSTGARREKLSVQPYDLVPYQEITDAYVRVAEFGAGKYSPWNWAAGLPRVQLLGSLLRHTFAYLRGEDRDQETGLLHSDHILWNAVAIVHNVHHGMEDGRRPDPSFLEDQTNGI